MAELTSADRARIQAIVDYLDAGSAGKTIDERSINELARLFGDSCGFKCGCPGTFKEGMRDSPYSTLLKVLLC